MQKDTKRSDMRQANPRRFTSTQADELGYGWSTAVEFW